MVTHTEYLIAKNIVEEYQRQVFATELNAEKHIVLSEWGNKMQKPHKKVGIIVEKYLAGQSDYSVYIVWEDGKGEWMHESHVTKA